MHARSSPAGATPLDVRAQRKELGVVPSFKRVDTCAAEFVAETPYLYSAYETFSESNVTSNKKVLILGAGPNRIGQGIEFDYCCCHASFALRCALSPEHLPGMLRFVRYPLPRKASPSFARSTVLALLLCKHVWTGAQL